MAKSVKKPSTAPEDLRFAGDGLRLLRLVADSLPALISYVDSHRRYLFNNKTYELLFGLSPEQLYGSHVREIIGDSYQNINKHVRIALSGRKTSFECFVNFKYGKKRYIHADLIPDISESGRVRGFFVLAHDISERNLLEEELRLSEEHFRSLVENASDVIAVISSEGSISYVSPPVKKIFGYKPEELTGKNLFEFFHPEDFDGLSKVISEVAQNPGMFLVRQGRVRHKNGSFRIIEGRGKAIFNKSGETGVVVNARDVTEEKRVEDEKSDLNKRLKSLWGVARMTESGYGALGKKIIKEVVSLAESPYGYLGTLNEDESLLTAYSFSEETRNACWIKQAPDVYPVEKAGLWADAIRKRKTVIVNDYPGEYPGRNKLPKGHVPLKRFMTVPIIIGKRIIAVAAVANKKTAYTKKDAEQIKTFVTSAQVLLDKKRADEALKKAEERYRGIFENSVEGIFQSMPGGGYITVNPSMARIFGYDSPDEMVESVADIGNQIYADPERHEELKLYFVKHDNLKGFEYQAFRKDGSVLWVSMNMRAVRDQKGKVLYYEGSIGDITEKKILQAEVMQNDRLAILGELAAGMAHEINNPINGIINYAQMMIDRAGGKKADIPARILKEGERIAGIVNILLGFVGNRREEKSSFRIGNIVRDTLAMIGAQMRKENIRIDIRIPPGLPDLNINGRQLQQVLLNLFGNSRYALNLKYPGADKNKIIRIRVKTEKAARKILITVYDKGPGIQDKLLKRVCDPFFTTKPAGEGTGLGLSVSRSIIEGHRGKLAVESKEGQYTKAVVELPV